MTEKPRAERPVCVIARNAVTRRSPKDAANDFCLRLPRPLTGSRNDIIGIKTRLPRSALAMTVGSKWDHTGTAGARRGCKVRCHLNCNILHLKTTIPPSASLTAPFTQASRRGCCRQRCLPDTRTPEGCSVNIKLHKNFRKIVWARCKKQRAYILCLFRFLRPSRLPSGECPHSMHRSVFQTHPVPRPTLSPRYTASGRPPSR